MVTRADRPTSSPLTSKQRKGVAAATKVLGSAADVRAYATGRANARLSTGAWWIIAATAAAVLAALVFLHTVIIPGFLVAYILYDAIRPRRGVAVTASGVSELKLSGLNGQPKSVLAAVDHTALSDARIVRKGNKVTVSFGAEAVDVRDRDFALLRDNAGTPSIPPAPPGTIPAG
jgi:hypothetical protein